MNRTINTKQEGPNDFSNQYKRNRAFYFIALIIETAITIKITMKILFFAKTFIKKTNKNTNKKETF